MIRHLPGWLDSAIATEILNSCLSWPLAEREVIVWERVCKLPRLTCFFSETGEGYRYSGQETPASPWPQEVLSLKRGVEQVAQTSLQHCLVNYYRTGNDCVGWHKDDESIFGPNPVIASVSLGATRKFKMRSKSTKEKQDFDLAHGDLLIFDGEHVLSWEHSIGRTTKPVGARLNLTFRSGK